MKIYLEPAAWSTTIDKAPDGFLMRIRKGRVELFLRTAGAIVIRVEGVITQVPVAVFNLEGKLTTVTGQVTPVKLKKE